MATVNVKSRTGEDEFLKRLLLEGINGEKKKIEYTLLTSLTIIRAKEDHYKISSAEFFEKFKNGEIEENDDTFQWWAELKLADSLKKQLETLNDIEICPQ